jgi:hypothetical protein
VKTIHLARIRAIIGSAFAVLGVGIAIQLLLRPEPFGQKVMGLGFAAVLIGLGVVRVRGYLLMRRAQP